jgi:hypothetical protein
MLEPETLKLWQVYLDAEKDRIQYVTMPALEKFIDALLGEDQQIWQNWVQDLAIQISDQKSEVIVRLPLFRRVIFPALIEGISREIPGCARALAELRLIPYKTQENQLPEHLQTSEALLQEALRQDPTDQLARVRLIRSWASKLEYAVHELPDGILFGQEFATLEECHKLLDLLEEFKTHVNMLHQNEQFSDLITECELHFRSYRDYLLHGWTEGSYEHYFEAHL